MIKELIFQHKKEKESLLAGSYIEREKLSFGKKNLKSNLIKVIVGPRRAGKSVFAILLLKDKNFGYLNFDDENLLKIKNSDEIVKGIFEVYGKPEFILFDEIQNFENWELFVNKLQRRGYNLILTGSNAKLLSRELATVLTGRHIPIEIFPFSFKEFLKARNFELSKEEKFLPENKGEILNLLDQNIKIGGLPEIVVKDIEPKIYLETLFDSVLFKDVVKRYKIRFLQKIYDLAIYFLSNFAKEFSFTKIKNNLNFNSVNTVQNYSQYLKEGYLFFFLNRYSFKIKEEMKSPKKVYVIDNGFILAKSFQFSLDFGRLLENFVFNELLKRGWQPNQSLFYYKTRNQKEVDFLLKEGMKIEGLIQVCYKLEPEIEKREIKGLLEASQELKCKNLLILTWDKKEIKRIKNVAITLKPVWQWLLED